MNSVSKSAMIAFVFAAASAMPSMASDLNDVFKKCVTQYGRSTKEATVTLECIAGDGKVSGCKVVEAPVPADGFDKAALCVAESLPIGSKTGEIKFPIKFSGNHY